MNNIFRIILFGALLFLLFNSNIVAYGQIETGTLLDVNLGPLEDRSVMFSSHSNFGTTYYLTDPDWCLNNHTYDLYIPPSYDGSEPYGLISFSSFNNNGEVLGAWKEVLDEKKLICVGGDNIPNFTDWRSRIGVTWAGLLRMKELYNIDTTRIYTTGKSGGGMIASVLSHIYPEVIVGTMPLCGMQYPVYVDQDYETRNPDGHYEAALPFYNTDAIDYIKSFNRRYAIMTSFDDFREGDIMNIYHNGIERDGLIGKFFERTGGHCATSTQDFRDAVNFVEHSFNKVIEDEFNSGDPVAGNGFLVNNAAESNGEMILNPNTDFAQIKSKDLFLWDDPKGVIFKTAIGLDNSASNPSNTQFYLGLWEYKSEGYQELEGTQLADNTTGIFMSVDFSVGQPSIEILIGNPATSATSLSVFSGQLTDWVATEGLKIKYHLWNNELRIEFSRHFDLNVAVSDGIKLLDDSRSVRIRWSEMGTTPDFWANDPWANSAFLTLASKKANQSLDGGSIKVNYIDLISEEIVTEEIVLAVNEDENFNTNIIYPNPTSGLIYIQGKSNELGLIKIYDTKGQDFTNSVQIIQEENKTAIDISGLLPGMYLIKTTTSANRVHKH